MKSSAKSKRISLSFRNLTRLVIVQEGEIQQKGSASGSSYSRQLPTDCVEKLGRGGERLPASKIISRYSHGALLCVAQSMLRELSLATCRGRVVVPDFFNTIDQRRPFRSATSKVCS
jgi:hypothetical protein